MINKRIALFGDVHGSIEELQLLHQMLAHESLDAVYHLGDLVDRGVDSGAVVSFCRENKIQGVLGNHEDVILRWKERSAKGEFPKNPDKKRTLEQITDPRDWKYLEELPLLHVFDDLQYIAVHGGLWPNLPWHLQPRNVCRAQLINVSNPGPTRWYGTDIHGVPEEENRAKGFVAWHEVYNHDYGVVVGHSVYGTQPKIFSRENLNPLIGVDTGCNWTGVLTAVILPDLKFIQTPLKRPLSWEKVKQEAE